MERIVDRAACEAPAEVAEGLIEEFGSVGAALAGDRHRQLRGARGDAKAVEALRDMKMLISEVHRAELDRGPLLDDQPALMRYLRADMGFEKNERLRVFFLDGANRLQRDEVIFSDTVDATPFYVREIVARAIQLGSCAIILAHNHPSGSTAPSASDVANTRALLSVCIGLGIDLHDHLIVSGRSVTSMRFLGLLEP